MASQKLSNQDAGERKVVLVVDDFEEILQLNRTILEIEGFAVLTAHSGEEALALLAQGNSPDLILMDMRMDGMSGEEFLLTLEKEKPDFFAKVPVILVTGLHDVQPNKAACILRKPVDVEKLIETVHTYTQPKE